MAFLDTTVIKYKTNFIYTNVYHKPTDNKNYLQFHSCNPRKQKESIPSGLFIRSRRTWTKITDYLDEAKIIKDKIL